MTFTIHNQDVKAVPPGKFLSGGVAAVIWGLVTLRWSVKGTVVLLHQQFREEINRVDLCVLIAIT